LSHSRIKEEAQKG